MSNEPYYLAYEKRYKAVFEAGVEHWGHTPDNAVLYETLKNWVESNNLKGKSIVEFACGEGASGVILSELGCKYHGYDISPSAVEKAREALKDYKNAQIDILDMVKDKVCEKYDAAFDSMGFHMLVTDSDRSSYLKNAFDSLNDGAPMLFFRESYRSDNAPEAIYKGKVNSIEEWISLTGSDYNTPSLRKAETKGGTVEVLIPLVPARANDREGYIEEMENAGFKVEKFTEMDISDSILYSASIYVRKPL